MIMFLMGLALAMFGLAVTAAAFGSATRTERRPELPAQPRLETVTDR